METEIQYILLFLIGSFMAIYGSFMHLFSNMLEDKEDDARKNERVISDIDYIMYMRDELSPELNKEIESLFSRYKSNGFVSQKQPKLRKKIELELNEKTNLEVHN